MKSKTKNQISSTVRAYPESDANLSNATHANLNEHNARASPRSDEHTDKNKTYSLTCKNIRLATWNLGTLTGRSQELSKVLQNRNINTCCQQETKWKGSKSRDIGQGYQLIYHGTVNGENGVALDHQLKQRIINIERKSDRLIGVKLAMDKQLPLNIISAYAQQIGCQESEKSKFWEDFDDLINMIPPEETKYIGGDLNGHVGSTNSSYQNTHGGHGYGTLNKPGEEILNFGSRHNLSIVNTYFQKKAEHLITYKSGGKSTQISRL
ncbi:hypothetical protein MSG28_003411 [Choristoneura fumiferana]|uniref:Uncharacterized protein n=1 Tax=Choristoneura fumiferana TaxID=7141 RepID=A0ACC0KEN0_CHOFU|nr:hypothetical protein MSG28_003411 [Choristoneura fumiferana]